MTADRFEMDLHFLHYHGRNPEGEWTVKVSDGDVNIEFDVYDEYIQQVVKDNFDAFSDTIKKEITDRIEALWDKSEISDEDKDAFIRILGKVVG